MKYYKCTCKNNCGIIYRYDPKSKTAWYNSDDGWKIDEHGEFELSNKEITEKEAFLELL